MAPRKTIFWDIGGVLLTNGWDRHERQAVYDQFHIDPKRVEERHGPANEQWERGEITVWEYLREAVFFEERKFSPQEFYVAMQAQSKELHPANLRVLRTVSAQGHRCVMLNNEAAELNDYRVERFHLRPPFAALFSSCYVGMRKPDRRIFLAALQVMQAKASESIFIDDRKENCDGARTVGIRAIQMETPEQLMAELRNSGIEWQGE